MTTVGYGDKTPRSVAGRMFSVLWILAGIIVFNTLAGEITSVNKLQSSIHAPQSSKHNKLSSWCPENVICRLPVILLENLWLCSLLETVEGDIEELRVSMDDTKLVTNRFPAEGMNCLLNFDSILLVQSMKLEGLTYYHSKSYNR